MCDRYTSKWRGAPHNAEDTAIVGKFGGAAAFGAFSVNRSPHYDIMKI
jgi:hypothetical protein